MTTQLDPSVREALARGGAATAGAKPRNRRSHEPDADTRALETDLSDLLSTSVRIRDRGGAGELRINYQNLEQLDDLCRRLSRPSG